MMQALWSYGGLTRSPSQAAASTEEEKVIAGKEKEVSEVVQEDVPEKVETAATDVNQDAGDSVVPTARAEVIGNEGTEETPSAKEIAEERTPSIRALPSMEGMEGASEEEGGEEEEEEDEEGEEQGSEDEYGSAYERAMTESVGSFGSPVDDSADEFLRQMAPKAKITVEGDDFSVPAEMGAALESDGEEGILGYESRLDEPSTAEGLRVRQEEGEPEGSTSVAQEMIDDVMDVEDVDEEEGEDGEEGEWDGDDDDEDEEDVDLAELVAAAEGELSAASSAVAQQTRGRSNGLGFAPLGPQPSRGAPVTGVGSSGAGERPQGEAAAAVGAPAPLPAIPREELENLDKLMLVRVKLLRLALRLGQSPNNNVVAQVLYRLQLAEQLQGQSRTGPQRMGVGGATLERANRIAQQLEAEQGSDSELGMELKIMLLGKTGVGKTATIRSLLNLPGDSVLEPTNRVREVQGLVHGVKLRLIDVPGLHPSVADLRQNTKILRSSKSFLRGSLPDLVLYVDRLDMQSRDFSDMPLLRNITEVFGPSIWMNAIVVFTHAAAAPPDGPNGQPLSYEMYLAQRSHVVQQTIRQTGSDARLMNPVALVENHPSCRTNRAGEQVLPNGQVWKPQLLLLCCASKALTEAHSLLNLKDASPMARQRPPHLPYLFSSMLAAKQPVRLPDEQPVGEDDDDDDGDDVADGLDDVDIDALPPFRRLRKEELSQLSPEQRREYYEELAERERLFQRKQYREEMRRRREARRKLEEMVEGSVEMEEAAAAPAAAVAEEEAAAANVSVPMPDLELPPSFDSDYPSHRFRFLEQSGQWVVRPLLEQNGWDHDFGYDSFQVEKLMAAFGKVPTAISGTLAKEKSESQLSLELKSSYKHGREGSNAPLTLGSFELQSTGKEMVYNAQAETVFSNSKRNKTVAGVLLAAFGASGLIKGLKVEDRLSLGKRLKGTAAAGAVSGGGHTAWGGQMEVKYHDKDYPMERSTYTVGVSMMKWQGDVALGGNVQSQGTIGKTVVSARAQLNNRGIGSISIRGQTHEQLQIALIGVFPLVRYLLSGAFLVGRHSE